MNHPRGRLLPWVNLALIALGFGWSAYLLDGRLRDGFTLQLWDDIVPIGASLAITITAVWSGLWLNESSQGRSSLFTTLQPVLGALGLGFLAQALLGYIQFAGLLPLSAMIGGAICTTVLLTIAGWLIYPRFLAPDAPVLYLGFDNVAAGILQNYWRPAAGILETSRSRIPEDMKYLGDPADLDSVIEAQKPGEIVVGLDKWASQISPRTLLQLRLDGIAIRESATLYENLLRRVCSDRLRPSDFIFSAKLDPPRRHLAFQAIYSNLLGLGLLILALPIIAIVSVLVKLFSGPGPAIERVDCVGFKEIPFRLLRFRTNRQDGTRRPTTIGKTLTALRLVKLPHLINVVRGEMVLVGPEPVRIEYAERLSKAIPFYAHRFSVKPGLTGWGRLHRQRRDVVRVLAELEYDFYYVRHVSPVFDLEILLSAAAHVG